jgi:hypothetical protein
VFVPRKPLFKEPALYAVKMQAPPASLIFFSASFEKNLALTAMGCLGSLPLPRHLKIPNCTRIRSATAYGGGLDKILQSTTGSQRVRAGAARKITWVRSMRGAVPSLFLAYSLRCSRPTMLHSLSTLTVVMWWGFFL